MAVGAMVDNSSSARDRGVPFPTNLRVMGETEKTNTARLIITIMGAVALIT
jgi:hypothetical protein